MKIDLYPIVGAFAEDKDKAREIRIKQILPAIKNGEKVILNFKSIDSVTQSFIHALISDVIRKNGIDVLDNIFFKKCNNTIQQIISIVVEYMQDVDYLPESYSIIEK